MEQCRYFFVFFAGFFTVIFFATTFATDAFFTTVFFAGFATAAAFFAGFFTATTFFAGFFTVTVFGLGDLAIFFVVKDSLWEKPISVPSSLRSTSSWNWISSAIP